MTDGVPAKKERKGSKVSSQDGKAKKHYCGHWPPALRRAVGMAPLVTASDGSGNKLGCQGFLCKNKPSFFGSRVCFVVAGGFVGFTIAALSASGKRSQLIGRLKTSRRGWKLRRLSTQRLKEQKKRRELIERKLPLEKNPSLVFPYIQILTLVSSWTLYVFAHARRRLILVNFFVCLRSLNWMWTFFVLLIRDELASS